MLIDNLIYGTFPDLPGSQQVVHKTAGITSEIEGELLSFFNEFGDCRNEQFRTSITVRHLRSTSTPTIAIVRVSQQGSDFSGRWGALLRHAAVLEIEKYRRFFFDPVLIAPALVSSGSSEELRAFGEINVEQPSSADSFLQELIALDFSTFSASLTSLMSGNRLLLYSEINNEISDSCLRRLVNFLPFSFKAELNWSEFMFKPGHEFDLLLAYNGRYEPPGESNLTLTPSGDSSLKQLELHPEYASDYVELLEAALNDKDVGRLADLICDLPR